MSRRGDTRVLGFVLSIAVAANAGTTQVGVPADFDGSGVRVTDLLELLAHWGSCP